MHWNETRPSPEESRSLRLADGCRPATTGAAERQGLPGSSCRQMKRWRPPRATASVLHLCRQRWWHQMMLCLKHDEMCPREEGRGPLMCCAAGLLLQNGHRWLSSRTSWSRYQASLRVWRRLAEGVEAAMGADAAGCGVCCGRGWPTRSGHGSPVLRSCWDRSLLRLTLLVEAAGRYASAAAQMRPPPLKHRQRPLLWMSMLCRARLRDSPRERHACPTETRRGRLKLPSSRPEIPEEPPSTQEA